MNVSLVLVKSDGSTKEFELGPLPVTMGRSDSCKVHVPLPSISRQHCKLDADEDEELIVSDLGSSNGTFVNGQRVKRHELVPGDVLALGDVTFVVRIDGHPRSIDAKGALESTAANAEGGTNAKATGSAGAGAKGGGGVGGGRRDEPMPTGDDLLAGIMDDNDDSDFDLDIMGDEKN